VQVDYWLDFIEDNKNPVKCDWCEKMVPSVKLYYVQSHWSFPKKLTAFCEDCENKYILKKVR
jgi:hypothetical protein